MASLRIPVVVRWSDMDAFGHVNNVQTLRLLEEARIRSFSGEHAEVLGLLETGSVVARHEVEYLLPLVWRPEPVDVDIWVTRTGGASFDLGYEISDDRGQGPDGRAVYLRAASTIVLVDTATGSPRRMDARQRELLATLSGGPVAFRPRGGA